MKAKYIKFLLPVLLSVTCLSGCKGQRKRYTYKLPTNAEVTGEYYKKLNFEQTGSKMQKDLHSFLFSKHSSWVEYNAFNGYLLKSSKYDSIDAVEAGSNQIQYFYTGKESKASSTTREHVWPCANSAGLWTHNEIDGDHYVDGPGYIGGGADLFHIRPCSSKVNTARGNAKYIDFAEYPDKESEVVEISDGGPYVLKISGASKSGSSYSYASRAEPADEMKGDIARILAYVWIHYKSMPFDTTKYENLAAKESEYEKMCGSLSFNSVLDCGDEESCREMLCLWNEYDPPSDVEILRNNTIQKIQGNRNPFVDYPGLMRRMLSLEE